jgi:hypothetical protein
MFNVRPRLFGAALLRTKLGATQAAAPTTWQKNLAAVKLRREAVPGTARFSPRRKGEDVCGVLVSLAGTVLLAGCTLNSNRALPSGAAPAPGRAVLIYGVALNAPQPGVRLHFDMVAYDIAEQKIDGNCFRFNRTEAWTDAVSGAVSGAVSDAVSDAVSGATSDMVRYVAFDVVPGHYTLSPFLPVSSDATSTAFQVPAGATVYVGDYLYQLGTRLAHVPGTAASTGAIRQALPALTGVITVATPLTVTRALPFMCTP